MFEEGRCTGGFGMSPILIDHSNLCGPMDFHSLQGKVKKLRKVERKFLSAAAQLEVEKLIESKYKFVLDADTLDFTHCEKCLYGQAFGSSSNDEAQEFQEDNGIIKVNLAGYSTLTALELMLLRLWSEDHKDQCFEILNTFVDWKKPKKKSKSKLFKLSKDI